MSMIHDIADYLAGAGLGTVGTDLFMSTLPANPDNCIAVYQYGGGPPQLAHDGAEIAKPGLQIRVRNASYAAGEVAGESVISALHPIANRSIGSGFYLMIQVNGELNYLGRDQNNRHEWSINFSVMKRR